MRLILRFYALSGLDVPEDRRIIDEFMQGVNPAKNYVLENDALASLALGSSTGYGVVLICGTGSNCVAINERGERLQVGGLGRPFGDFSGGREIAFQAMAAAARGHDGRGPKTKLHDKIKESLGFSNLAEFSPILHHSMRSYPIANLVPLVFEAATEGDQVAMEILRYNGEELALSAEVAIRRLFQSDESVEVILTGGVFKNDGEQILISALETKLKARCPKAKLRLPAGEPVVGALIQALRMAGHKVGCAERDRLVREYEDMVKA